jgi:hypothetical protein
MQDDHSRQGVSQVESGRERGGARKAATGFFGFFIFFKKGGARSASCPRIFPFQFFFSFFLQEKEEELGKFPQALFPPLQVCL